MNQMNDLEIQLRSWAPRRPSARLEAQLFPHVATVPEVEAPWRPQLSFRLRWLAPATAGLVLLCVMFNQRYGSSINGATNSGPFLALISSNQSFAAYSPGKNGPPIDTFEWTNGSGSTSSIGPLSPAKAPN